MHDARILVAEDDPVTVRFLQSLLEENGFEVLVAEDGRHAHELATSGSPDLIISDLVMPYRDGFGLIRALRTLEALTRVPIIILSMKDREADIVRGLEEGADDYVVKPFNARELLARVRKQLDRPRS
ncbi:MAG: response regulator [Acidobacteria bacterium]|uniref:Response regulator n=1 Tax=Candidatus Polarisedimenticola svalbardensis TaxID=2886004 RepID=A0A8J6Y197_9BACT|nr:response regulator [Candidatus Polarisedimenticola svalbardensis]